MDDLEYKQEHKIATAKFERITSSIPAALLKKENEIFERIKKNKRNPLNKLVVLYDFMNSLYKHVNQNTFCKKGCNNCCFYKVSISELEAQLIENKTGYKRSESINNLFITDYHGSPCPFLKNEACSIYDVRPFVCRRFVTLASSERWCHPNIANSYEFPLLNFSEIDKSYDYIVNQSGYFNQKDIREIFMA